MLKARITNSSGIYADYIEEFVDLSYNVSNNEGTAFVASMPSLTAVVKLSVCDDFTKGLKRGNLIQITSEEEGGLILWLSIIEVSTLDRKNTTEISCTGAFFDETNDIWGTINVGKDTWVNTQAKFTLDNVEHHEDNDQFYAHVRAKSDIIMGLAWSYDTRRTVALTPFTTASDVYYKGFGAGIFKEVREGQSDEYAPVYRIAADQIISYDISPAQPPVTHIVSMSLGDTGFVASTPEIIVSHNGLNASLDTTRTYFIQELQLAANLVHYSKQGTGSTIVYDKSVIYWSDGVETELLGYSSAAEIKFVGITNTGYVLLDANGRVFSLYDRQTKELISTYTTTHTVADTMSTAKTRKEHYILCADNRYKTLMFFDPSPYGVGSASQAIVGIAIADDNVITELDMPHHDILSKPDILVSASCKVKWGDKNAIALLVNAIHTDASPGNMAVQVTVDGVRSSTVAMLEDEPTYLFPRHYSDFIASTEEPSEDSPAYAIRARYAAGTYDFITLVIFRGSQTESIVFTDPTWTLSTLRETSNYWLNYMFVYDKDIIISSPSDFHIVSYIYTGAAGNVYTRGVWRLRSLIYDTTQYRIAEIQAGRIEEWFSGRRIMPVTGAVTLIKMIDNSTQSVTVQIAPVPTLVRSNVKGLTPQMISSGNRNELSLSFRAGLISQTAMALWDEDKGRIELSIAAFKVRNNNLSVWVDKSVQALNVMAVGAYCKVWLDPDNQNDYVTIKVLEYKLTYSGGVKAKVVGMIVQDEPYIPPERMPDRYVKVTSTSQIKSGEKYLIVGVGATTTGYVFKSNQETLYATRNAILKSIVSDPKTGEKYIEKTAELEGYEVTITAGASGATIRTPKSTYITRLQTTAGIDESSTAQVLAMSMLSGHVVFAVQSTRMVLNFNYSSAAKNMIGFFPITDTANMRGIDLYRFVPGE